MNSKLDSRKQKIDPALAVDVKKYLQMLDSVIPPDSKTSNRLLEKVCNAAFRSLKPFYEEQNDHRLDCL